MKALTWHGKRDVRVDQVPDPAIQDPTDIIVRITSTAICGSDLHLYEIFGPFLSEGDILGHEPMGIVEEVGPEVTNVAVGDRVVIPFNVSCQRCWMCEHGLNSQCETTQNYDEGMGASLLGYTKLYGSVPGGQAEFLRVPFGNTLPIKVPHGPPDERYLFLSDVLPTAWQGVQYADVGPGDSLVVLGLGPIGDMACRVARQQGVENVIGIDLVPERLERVRGRGIDVLDVKAQGDDILDIVKEKTGGRGPDAVVDAVGAEAHGAPIGKLMHQMVGFMPDAIAEKMMKTAGVDRLSALHLAIEMVRRGGTISLSGVYGGQADPMPMLTLFDKQIQLRQGQANVWSHVEDIMPLLTDDDPLGVDAFPTHHMPLDEAPHGYEIFQKKQDGAIKIVLNP
jgi:threonine dehydrogenase-like Zn-dependent dehydrogenase